MEAVYIIGGPELGRRNAFMRHIRDKAAAEWNAEPEEHKIYAADCSVPELIDLLAGGSLFSEAKIVYCFGADQIKAKADTDALRAYMQKPAPNTLLFLVSDGIGVDKALEEFVPGAAKKIFWELSPAEAETWLKDYFAEKELKAEQSAIDALLSLVENNTQAFTEECARLALFFPKGSSIQEDDVERYIAHNRSENSFTLFDAMAAGGFAEALEVLAAILAEKAGSGIGIMAGLLWSFRRLGALHETLSQGQNFEAAARALRITRKQAISNYRRAANAWPQETCSSLTAFGVDIDARLRTLGQAHEKILLELFLYAAMRVKRPLRLGAL